MKKESQGCLGILFASSEGQKGNEIFYRVISGFSQGAREYGYDALFLGKEFQDSIETDERTGDTPLCQGVLLVSVDEQTLPQAVSIIDEGIPVVSVDYAFDRQGSIWSDNRQGVAELVRLAFSMGHERIALVHGEDSPLTRARIRSFCETCADLGKEVPEEYIRKARSYDPDSAAEQTRSLLGLEQVPTCIFYADDYSCVGGMGELSRNGYSVPGDISIVGYGGFAFSQTIVPKLTTLRQNAEGIGSAAAEELVHMIRAGKTYIPQRSTIPGFLIKGESLAPLAKADV